MELAQASVQLAQFQRVISTRLILPLVLSVELAQMHVLQVLSQSKIRLVKEWECSGGHSLFYYSQNLLSL